MPDEMKNIITCKFCGNQEYYGMMHWLNGTTMCRKCIYKVWQGPKNNWTPGSHDYVFPLYEDGIDYTTLFKPKE
jgi:hypothetical protein